MPYEGEKAQVGRSDALYRLRPISCEWQALGEPEEDDEDLSTSFVDGDMSGQHSFERMVAIDGSCVTFSGYEFSASAIQVGALVVDLEKRDERFAAPHLDLSAENDEIVRESVSASVIPLSGVKLSDTNSQGASVRRSFFMGCARSCGEYDLLDGLGHWLAGSLRKKVDRVTVKCRCGAFNEVPLKESSPCGACNRDLYPTDFFRLGTVRPYGGKSNAVMTDIMTISERLMLLCEMRAAALSGKKTIVVVDGSLSLFNVDEADVALYRSALKSLGSKPVSVIGVEKSGAVTEWSDSVMSTKEWYPGLMACPSAEVMESLGRTGRLAMLGRCWVVIAGDNVKHVITVMEDGSDPYTHQDGHLDAHLDKDVYRWLHAYTSRIFPGGGCVANAMAHKRFALPSRETEQFLASKRWAEQAD